LIDNTLFVDVSLHC